MHLQSHTQKSQKRGYKLSLLKICHFSYLPHHLSALNSCVATNTDMFFNYIEVKGRGSPQPSRPRFSVVYVLTNDYYHQHFYGGCHQMLFKAPVKISADSVESVAANAELCCHFVQNQLSGIGRRAKAFLLNCLNGGFPQMTKTTFFFSFICREFHFSLNLCLHIKKSRCVEFCLWWFKALKNCVTCSNAICLPREHFSVVFFFKSTDLTMNIFLWNHFQRKN